MSSETSKALGLISIYTGLLFFLIGWAGGRKMDFHFRTEIATAGFYAAAAFVIVGVVFFLLSFKGKQS
ncbi:MAG TPA: hypothetical protein VJ252_07060 [Chthoniobacterales bacterium]|jgi:hypothetical protein|nr:hypothetical protein [Chthoniobacterales bacterium]